MPESKNIVRDSVKDIAVSAATELVGAVPGGATVYSVVQRVCRYRAEERARLLFTAIGVATGAGDAENAAESLARHVDEPWFQEAIEAGYRELMNAFEPAIRRCIAILVAEYVVMQKAPDLKFRRVGDLLQAIGAESLPSLLTITKAYLEELKAGPSGSRVLVRTASFPAMEDAFWVSTYTSPRREWETAYRGNRKQPVPQDFDNCTRALINARLGQPWYGMSDAAFEGNPIVAFNSSDEDCMKLLHTCIQTAEQSGAFGRGVAVER